MKFISPETFKRTFLEVAISSSECILRDWQHAGAYTSLMLSSESGLLVKIATKLELQYFREYWTIDAIFYERRDEQFYSHTATYAENIALAIEHENNSLYSHVEMNKLGILNTPLAVLITYPRLNEESVLKDYSNILRAADVYSDFHNKRQKIVVLGKMVKGEVLWSFYRFNGQAFELM